MESMEVDHEAGANFGMDRVSGHAPVVVPSAAALTQLHSEINSGARLSVHSGLAQAHHDGQDGVEVDDDIVLLLTPGTPLHMEP